MNTQLHSPGPWECRGYPTPLGVVFDISQSAPGDVDVAYTYSHSGNAQLIAAAPCLLEALDTLCLVVGLTAFKHAAQMVVLQEAVDLARKAINKATGGTT